MKQHTQYMLVLFALAALLCAAALPACNCNEEQGKQTCETDEDCGDVFVCRNGQCVDPRARCKEDKDCPEGKICDPRSGFCIEPCEEDKDCPKGYFCDPKTGLCRESCTAESCPKGQICDPKTGLCKDKPFKCTKDEDCKERPEGELCDTKTGRCYKGGTLP